MCKSSVTYNLKGRIYIVDDDESITGSDELVSFEIKADAFTNNTFIGSVVTKSIEIELLNTVNSRNLSGKTVKAFVSYNNEEIPFGTFKIEDKSNGDVKKQTTFVGYDLMNTCKDKYVDTVTYPTTIANLLSSVCSEMGVELATSTFPNSTFIITGNPFTNGETNQIVLNSICQIAGGFAYIGRDDKLYIKNLELNNKVERIDPTVYFEDFVMKDYYSPINTVIVALPDVEGENVTKRDDVYASIVEIKGNVDNYIALTGNCVLNANNNQYLINLGSIELINALDKFNVEVTDGKLYKNIYEDKLYYQNSEWFLRKELDSKIFTGNENWIASSQGAVYKYSLAVNNLSTESKDIWSEQIDTKLSDADFDNYIYIENENIVFSSTSIATLNDFKNYIANKKVFYVLNNATTISVATAYPSLYAQLLELNTLELESGNNTLYLESENTVRSIIKLEYNDIYGKQVVEDEYINIDDVISVPNQEIKIEENYILTSDEDRRNIINELFNALNGINYLPFSVSYYGFPYLDIGDNITVVDTERNEYNGYIFNLSFKYNGGFSGKIDAPKIDKIVEKIKNSTDLKTKFRNVELSVNKIEGKITSIVEEIGDRTQKTTTITQDIDGINSSVGIVADLTNVVSGTNPIELTNCMKGDLVELDIFGNNNVFSYPYPSNTLYPSDILYPYEGSSKLKVYSKNLVENAYIPENETHFYNSTWGGYNANQVHTQMYYDSEYTKNWQIRCINLKPNTRYVYVNTSTGSNYRGSIFDEYPFNENYTSDNQISSIIYVGDRIYDYESSAWINKINDYTEFKTPNDKDTYYFVMNGGFGNTKLYEVAEDIFSEEIDLSNAEDGTFTISNRRQIISNTSSKSITVEIPSDIKMLKVQKKSGKRFALATFTNIPSNNAYAYNYKSDDNNGADETELTISVGDNDKYLVIYYYENGVDTENAINLKDSIKIYGAYGNYRLIDLQINEVLRQSGTYKDKLVITNGKELLYRYITYVNGEEVIVENPTPIEIQDLSIELVEDTNYIEILEYSAMLSAKYVQKNEFTNIFATTYEVKSLIQQLADQINLKVSRGNIIAELNMGIDEENGNIDSYIYMKSNKLKIDSDNFNLALDGTITTHKGNIGGLTLLEQSLSTGGVSELWGTLLKTFSTSSGNFASGLLIPQTVSNGTFIVAGMEVANGTWSTSTAKLRITHDGNIYMNGQSRTVSVTYDSGRNAMILSQNGIHWRLDDSANGFFGSIEKGSNSINTFLNDATAFNIYDNLHGGYEIVSICRYAPESSSAELRRGNRSNFTSDLNVIGNRYDGVNYTMHIQGYEVATNASDERLKENIETSDSKALDTINKIQIRKFDWRTDKHLRQGGEHINNGFIAQEVMKIDETLVHYDRENDTYQMETLSLLGLSYKAIQELNQKVEEQNRVIQMQNETIEKLIKRIEKLEKGE